jgi:hypothetical protein
MKRTKRFTLRRIALGLAVLTVMAPVAQAKPTPSNPSEIPYLSHGTLAAPSVGVDDRAVSRATSVGQVHVGVDDRAVARATSVGQVQIPYLSHGTLTANGAVDDRAFSKATTVGAAPVAGVEDGYEFSVGVVGGIAAAMAALLGAALLIRHGRRTRLSPA